MATRQNRFLLRRSNVPNNVPSSGQLLLGELGLNTADVILYASGTTSNTILPIGWDRLSITGGTINGNLTVNGQSVFSSTTDNVVTIVGSGSTNPLFTISGSSGELFSVSDNLTGELLSINNINAESIFVVNDDNTILMGDYPTLSLNTTINVTVSAGTSEILYIIPSGYTSSYFDYNVFNAVGVRAGNVMGIWSGSSIQYTEVSTNDIGNTDDIGIYMEMSGSTALFKGSATTYNWVVKSIVKLI